MTEVWRVQKDLDKIKKSIARINYILGINEQSLSAWWYELGNEIEEFRRITKDMVDEPYGYEDNKMR